MQMPVGLEGPGGSGPDVTDFLFEKVVGVRGCTGPVAVRIISAQRLFGPVLQQAVAVVNHGKKAVPGGIQDTDQLQSRFPVGIANRGGIEVLVPRAVSRGSFPEKKGVAFHYVIPADLQVQAGQEKLLEAQLGLIEVDLVECIIRTGFEEVFMGQAEIQLDIFHQEGFHPEAGPDTNLLPVVRVGIVPVGGIVPGIASDTLLHPDFQPAAICGRLRCRQAGRQEECQQQARPSFPPFPHRAPTHDSVTSAM